MRAALIFAIGFAVGLAGDATHVAAGVTRYEWDGVPVLWRSAIWFPVLVGGAVLAAAWLADRLSPPAGRVRGRADVAVGAAAVLALYALTAVVHDQPPTVSVVLTGAIAVAVWAWWDPSPRAFGVAAAAAVLGPLAEILIVEAGAASYAADADGLLGVGEWLPCLYFAAGAVASGLWPGLSVSPASRPSR